jgi:redox-sensitive bicupin YhaK (pirin superfamily)
MVITVDSHPDEDDPESRLLMPTREEGPFLPFERFAETFAKSRTEIGFHPHEAQEVIAYILEGYVHHEDATGHHADLSTGSVLVVTAHQEIRHRLTLQPRSEDHKARWLSIVLRLPWHTEPPMTSIQIKEAGDAAETHDGTIRRPVVGPLARADSAMGLECTDVSFTEQADVSFQVGRGRRGVAYVLEGSGSVEKAEVGNGQGVLFENITRFAVHGLPGFRLFLASVPTAGSEESYPMGERFQGARFPGGRDRPDRSAPHADSPEPRSRSRLLGPHRDPSMTRRENLDHDNV